MFDKEGNGFVKTSGNFSITYPNLELSAILQKVNLERLYILYKHVTNNIIL